jgi:hypothetical protein
MFIQLLQATAVFVSLSARDTSEIVACIRVGEQVLNGCSTAARSSVFQLAASVLGVTTAPLM